MIRKRFDREAAWEVYKQYVAIPVPATGDNSKEANLLRIQKENLYHAAYNLSDEIIEIGIRQVFARNKNVEMVDDLRQAARLRLYQFLPKMSELCKNSEHFFRMCLAGARWAALNEYARLKRQSGSEVHTKPLHESFDEEDSELTNDIAVVDLEFDTVEKDRLSNQIEFNAKRSAYARITEFYTDPKVRTVAIMVLDAAIEGTEIADVVIKDFGGSRELQMAVRNMWREAVAKEQDALFEQRKRVQ